MALSAVSYGAPQFYRGGASQAVPQNSLVQQSKDLSDAVNALRSPTVAPTSVRASTGTQMATLCLVQPGDGASSAAGATQNSVASAYAMLQSD